MTWVTKKARIRFNKLYTSLSFSKVFMLYDSLTSDLLKNKVAMEIINTTNEIADVQLLVQELATLNNALNEVYHTIHASEFKTRMGVSREEVRALSDTLLQLIEKLMLKQT